MGKICFILFCTPLIFASIGFAQCSVATVTIIGMVEHAPRNPRIRIRLVYPKKEHEESVDVQLDGEVFRIPVEFLTESRRRWLNNIGEKCDRKPKTVVITLLSGDEEYARASLDFLRDFEKSDPSNYTVRREVVLRGAQP